MRRVIFSILSVAVLAAAAVWGWNFGVSQSAVVRAPVVAGEETARALPAQQSAPVVPRRTAQAVSQRNPFAQLADIAVASSTATPHLTIPHNRSVVVTDDNELRCRHDDKILQYNRGKKQWQCVDTADAVFGILDKTVRVMADGAIACRDDNQQLYYNTHNDKWHCGSVGNGIHVTLSDLDDVAQLRPAVNDMLTYSGTQWRTTDSLSLARVVAQNITGDSVSATTLSVSGATTMSGAVTLSHLTANRLVATDANSNLVSTLTEANLESSLSGVSNVFTNNDTITSANIADEYLRNTGDTATGDYTFSGALTAATLTGALADKGGQVCNVTAYGAKGDDSTDDYAAIMAAVAACDGAGIVYFPAGEYRISQPITLDRPVTLRGSYAPRWTYSSTPRASLKPTPSFSGSAIVHVRDKAISGQATDNNGGRIENLTIDGNSYGTDIDGIYVEGLVRDWRLSYVDIRQTTGDGFHTDQGSGSGYPRGFTVEHLAIYSPDGHGFRATALNDSYINDVLVVGGAQRGFYLTSLGETKIVGSRAVFNALEGLYIDGSTNNGGLQFTDFSTDRNDRHGVLILATGHTGITFNGLLTRRDGKNDWGGTDAPYAGVAIIGSAGHKVAPVIISDLVQIPGVNDGGGGEIAPSAGVRVEYSEYVSIDGMLWGKNDALVDNGNNDHLIVKEDALLKTGYDATEVARLYDDTSRWYTTDGGDIVYTASGNVGIGTTSPGAKVDVHESTADTAAKLILSDANSRALTLTSPRASDLVARIGITGTASDLALGTRDYTQALYIDNTNGYVGFGTTTPSKPIHLSGPNTPSMRITDTTNDVTMDVRTDDYQAFVGTASNHDLRLMTNGTSQVTLTTSGRLGIGTTNPSYLLDVSGTARLTGDLRLAGALYDSSNSAGTSGYLLTSTGSGTAWADAAATVGGNFTAGSVIFSDGSTLTEDNSNFYWDDTNNRVGIGTTSPEVSLHIKNSSISSIYLEGGSATYPAKFRFVNSNTGNFFQLLYDLRSQYNGLTFWQNIGGSWKDMMSLREDGNITFFAGSTGNVGIGTTTPSEKLHIAGDTDPLLRIQRASTGTGDAAALVFTNSTDAQYEHAAIKSIRQGTNVADLSFSVAGGTAQYASLDEVMRITNSGNVGIGTTSPDRKLHVVNNSSTMIAKFESQSPSNASYIQFSNPLSTADQVRIGSTGTRLDLSTNYTPRLSITNTGNVGIGTTSPGALLDLKKPMNSSGDTQPFLKISPTDNMDNLSSNPNMLEISAVAGNVPKGYLINANISSNARTGAFKLSNGDGTFAEITSAVANNNGGYSSPLTGYSPATILGVGVDTNSWFDGGTPAVGVGVNINITGWGGSTPSYRSVYGVPVKIRAANPSANSYAFYADVADANKNYAFYAENGMSYFKDNVGIGTTAPGQKLQVGTAGDGTVAVANAWNTFSDRRFKDNIISYTGALDKILTLNPVNFTWKESGTHDIGFIAQEVNDVIPEVVSQDSEGYYSVNYARLIAPTIAAIQEQQQHITQNTLKISALSTLTGLTDQVNALVESVQTTTDTATTALNSSTDVETALATLTAQLTDTTTAQTTLDGRITTLESDLAQLTDTLTQIQEQNTTILDFFQTLNPDTLVLTDTDGNASIAGILTVQKVEAEEVETTKLCVGDVCVDEEGLRALLENAGVENLVDDEEAQTTEESAGSTDSGGGEDSEGGVSTADGDTAATAGPDATADTAAEIGATADSSPDATTVPADDVTAATDAIADTSAGVTANAPSDTTPDTTQQSATDDTASTDTQTDTTADTQAPDAAGDTAGA